jgi:hypothetical protein
MSTPAGWYPDPTGRHQNRWFDGNDWTDQVADGQVVGIDPVRGGPPATEATPAAGADATQVTPAATSEVPPTAATPATPPPGAPPLGEYAGPAGSTSGGSSRKGLLIAAAVVVVVVIVGLVLTLGGGDDGGSEDAGSSGSSSQPADDQSDDPDEEEDEDPSASDLFDDMADEANEDGNDDIFGTDDEPADEPEDTVADGEYPQEVIDNFNNSCTSSGAPADYCGCIIDVLQRDDAYDRFVEIDAELAEDPTAIPPELEAAVSECQGG